MAKLSPNAKGVERVDAQGTVSVEDVDLAVNKTTKLVDKSYEIYLSLYQAVTGTDEERNIYKQFSPDFFDLIVVDECHRAVPKTPPGATSSPTSPAPRRSA